MSDNTRTRSARAAAIARRRAQVKGKQALTGGNAQPSGGPQAGVAGGREAARAHRRRQVFGAEAQPARPADPPAETREEATDEAPREERPARRPRRARQRPVEQPALNARRERRGNRRPAPGTLAAVDSPARLRSKARRKAQALGKSAVEAQQGQAGTAGTLTRMANPEASGREVAKQVRAERCAHGKTNCNNSGSRPLRRRRKASQPESAPAKVGEGETGHGQTVSGTMVGRRETVTGGEAGECRSVTGTEYLGADDFRAACGTELEAGPSKVGVTHTRGGRQVSGTEVGRSARTTGDLSGQCAAVTGTEYLPADQSELFCGTQGGGEPRQRKPATAPAARPAESGNRVTGGEKSGGTSVTGSQHVGGGGGYSRGPSGEARPAVMPVASKAPTKVAESETASGARVTGTQAGLDRPVTGDEPGYCATVSGTPYQGAEEVRAKCQTEPAPTANKVTGSFTQGGQRLTGSRTGEGEGMTGAEPGRCQRVTGTPYMGMEQARQACDATQVESMQDAAPRYSAPGHAISGTQAGPAGLTGAHRGACEPVTGTPYHAQAETAAVCGASGAAEPGEPDFPIALDGGAQAVPPAAASAPRASFTGAFANGTGKVTGDEGGLGGQRPAAPAGSPTGRVTGEGSDTGASITGDAWDRGDRVTGTEGPWAQRRNPSHRGTPGAAFAGAAHYRPVEGHETPETRISGSSGNTDAGAMVTVSGGARG